MNNLIKNTKLTSTVRQVAFYSQNNMVYNLNRLWYGKIVLVFLRASRWLWSRC